MPVNTSFLKGFIVGFLIAMPIGPIAIICIQRTLNEGKLHGIVSGLGAATADAFYSLLAALGLTFVSNFLVKEQLWFRLVGGFFLCYIGVKIFLSKFTQRTNTIDNASCMSDYVSAFFLTLTNPLTFLALAAIFAGMGIVKAAGHYLATTLLVLGVFTGSSFWWIILNSTFGMFLKKLGYDKLAWLNKVSGIIIACFGLCILLTLKI